MKRYIRSWLYVSGAREEHFEKAMASDADAVVFDLEDSVAHNAKDAARTAVIEYLSSASETPRVAVRVNAPGTAHGVADLAALTGCPVGAIRVPKVDDVSEVALVADALHETGPEIQPIIESARGFANLAQILEVKSVNRVCLGEGDLSADLGVDRRWFDGIRLDVVLASRLAEAWQPIQGVFTEIANLDGLRLTTEAGESQGFFGRSVIHPSQVAVVNDVYTPSSQRLSEARAMMSAVREAERQGSSAVRLSDGQFADTATLRAARRIIDIAEELGQSL